MAEQLRGVYLHGLEVSGAYHAGRKIGLGRAGSVLLPALGRNLIVNPGFETGDLTGWTVRSGRMASDESQERFRHHQGS